MTSYNIMKLKEFDDSVFYRAACDCTSKDHDITLMLSKDDSDSIDLVLFMDVRFHSWWNMNWFKIQWLKFKWILKLIFTGRIEMEGDFIFQGKEHIQEFINALNEGMDKLEN